MSADRALSTLGTIIDGTHKRDAVHIAVIPAVCGDMRLDPGEHVYLQNGLAYGNTGATNRTLVGIVDPFLDMSVAKGERFWLMLYPRTITSLRHVWTHPDFPEEVR